MSIDLVRARRETPGCESVLHFNNAGAALMPQPVLDATIDYLRLEAAMGAYEALDRSREIVERTYDSIGRLLGCEREEVALMENATRAWDMVFYAIPLRSGDRILTTTPEYASNYIAFLQRVRHTGAAIEVVPSNAYGEIDLEALSAMLDERVKVLALTHVPTNGGLVQPAAKVGRIAREAGVFYLLDATQSVGQMPVDVGEIGCDALCATGRKYLRGPRGTAFLYVRRERIERLEPPFLDNHAAEWVARDEYRIRSDARRFESWEANAAGSVGLGAAVDYALQWDLESIRDRVFRLAKDLRTQLSAIPGLLVPDLGRVRCGIVTFSVEGFDPAEIRMRLRERGINVGLSPKSNTRLDMEARGFDSLVRASVHYYNSENEVDRFCETLREVVED